MKYFDAEAGFNLLYGKKNYLCTKIKALFTID
jgi:hypothetical protein